MNIKTYWFIQEHITRLLHKTMSNNTILFICGNVHPDSSQGVRYKKLLPFWGVTHDVTLLAYHHLPIQGIQEQVNIYAAAGTVNHSQKSSVKSFILKIYKRFFRQFVFPDRYKYALPAYKKHIAAILSKHKFDTVIIGMTPYSLYPLTRFIKSIDPSIRVFIDLSDPFLGNAGNAGKVLFSNSLVKRYESRFLKYCDGIVVLNPTIQKLYKEVYNLKNRVHVIEQGFSYSLVNKLDPIERTEKNNLIYAGGLNKKFRDPFPLYHAIEQAEDKWTLDLYGNIAEELLPSRNSNIHYHGLANHISLLEKYIQSDVIVFIDNAFGYQVPGKLMEVVSIGKPVLFIYSNPKSPSFHYIDNASHVIKVPNVTQNIIEKLNKIRKTEVSFDSLNKYKQYEWKSLAKKYLNIVYE